MKKLICLVLALAMLLCAAIASAEVAPFDTETPITLYYALDGSGAAADA